jgi:hypothetical protein
MGFMDWLTGGQKYHVGQHAVANISAQGQRLSDDLKRSLWFQNALGQGGAGTMARKLGEDAARQQQDVRNRQSGLAYALERRARGEAPSAAELQMQEGIQAAQRSAMSRAAGMRGVAPGLARYLAGQQATRAQQGIAGQTGIMRAQEQAQAEQTLAQALQGMRAQDLGREELGRRLTQQYIGMGMTADQAAIAAAQAEEQLKLGAYQAYNQARAQAYQPSFLQELAGAGLQAGASYLGGLGGK